jgi:ADP-heptose:LPS heptosyltransferase
MLIFKHKEPIIFTCGGGIGNVIQTTPTIQLLAKKFIVDIFIGNGCSSEIINLLKISGVRNIFYRTLSDIEYAYQLNAVQHRNQRPNFNAKIKINPRLSFKKKSEAKVYGYLAVQLGITDPLPQSKISIESPIEKRQKIVAIYPGSKRNYGCKRWNKFDFLANKFKKVIVVGTKADIYSHGKPTWIKRKWNWPKNVSFFFGNLEETTKCIANCSLFIGNDGGLSHISAAMQIPTFVIFGPTSPLKNLPYSPTAYAISKNKPCSPCQFTKHWLHLVRTSQCKFNNRCLSNLTVEDVMHVIEEKTSIDGLARYI